MAASSHVPAGADAITVDWLSRVLRDTGIAGATGFEDVTVTRNRLWNVAETAFVEAMAGDATYRFFVKIRQEPDPLEHLFPGEYAFYARRRGEGLPLATCHAARRDPETGATCLVLADMRETHVETTWPLPPTESRCRAAMEAFAKIHAHGWNAGAAGDRRTALIDRERLIQKHVEGLLPDFFDRLGDRLSRVRRDLFEQTVSRVLASKSDRLGGSGPVCPIHGDAHFWNLLYPHDPRRDGCVVIDWEDWRIDFGAGDLALAMAMHWFPERRARLEAPLLRHYLESLHASGVSGYGWDDLNRDYRTAHLCNAVIPVFQFDAARSHASWWANLERWFLAFDDLGCRDLL